MCPNTAARLPIHASQGQPPSKVFLTETRSPCMRRQRVIRRSGGILLLVLFGPGLEGGAKQRLRSLGEHHYCPGTPQTCECVKGCIPPLLGTQGPHFPVPTPALATSADGCIHSASFECEQNSLAMDISEETNHNHNTATKAHTSMHSTQAGSCIMPTEEESIHRSSSHMIV